MFLLGFSVGETCACATLQYFYADILGFNRPQSRCRFELDNFPTELIIWK